MGTRMQKPVSCVSQWAAVRRNSGPQPLGDRSCGPGSEGVPSMLFAQSPLLENNSLLGGFHEMLGIV